MDFWSVSYSYQVNTTWKNFLSILPDFPCEVLVEFQEGQPASTCNSPFIYGLLELYTVMLAHI